MVYPYSCQKCSINVDIIKKLAEFDRIEPCSKCGEPMQRGMSAPALSFSKGGAGFYVNDYPKPKPLTKEDVPKPGEFKWKYVKK